MLARLVEWFWRGEALAQTRERAPASLRILLGLRDAAETIGFSGATLVAQRLLLGRLAALVPDARVTLDPAAGVSQQIAAFERLCAQVDELRRRDGRAELYAQRFRRMVALALVVGGLGGLLIMLGSAR